MPHGALLITCLLYDCIDSILQVTTLKSMGKEKRKATSENFHYFICIIQLTEWFRQDFCVWQDKHPKCRLGYNRQNQQQLQQDINYSKIERISNIQWPGLFCVNGETGVKWKAAFILLVLHPLSKTDKLVFSGFTKLTSEGKVPPYF